MSHKADKFPTSLNHTVTFTITANRSSISAEALDPLRNMKKHRTIVIKLGTSSIVDERTHQPLLSILSLIVETAVKLRNDGHRVVIVSSGAIGVGLRRMDIDRRPKVLAQVQALAAIGQCRLISLWDSLFGNLRQPIAQILLTRNDIADRTQYLNAQNTFSALFQMGVIPIVNENDTLAVSEIKFGDNDTLSGITAAMVSADYLFLMTDVDCLYTTNPRKDPNAKPIPVVSDISKLQADVASAGSALGTGGMGTKIVAARLATSAGITVVITKSSKPGNITGILEYVESIKSQDESSNSSHDSYVPLHTRFTPSPTPIRDRRFWLLHGLAAHGTIYVDEGAFTALSNHAGLLPVGIVDVEGQFAQQEAVKIVVVRRAPPSSRPLSLHEQSPLRLEQSISSLDELSMQEDDDIDSPTSRPSTPATALATGGLGGYESGFDFGMPSSPVVFSPSLSQTDLTSPSMMSIIDTSFPPREVGRALVNYSSAEISRIKGLRSGQIAKLLGYADSEYVAYRENISMTATSETSQRAKRSSVSSSTKTVTSQPVEGKRLSGLANFG